MHPSPLTLIALLCAGFSAVICVGYLVLRPVLNAATKLWLLLGLGVFPIGVAAAGNIQDYEAMKSREFCGSCHVMIPYKEDSENEKSVSLASRHARNTLFGADNCYACHADYGMFGTITTKMGGMRHVYLYLTEYRNTPLEEAKKTIHILKPLPNRNCMQCHSTKDEFWLREPDHKSALEDVREGRVSCASGGCHGFGHPFSKPDEDVKKAEAASAKHAQAKAAAALTATQGATNALTKPEHRPDAGADAGAEGGVK